mgnify:CR=1 FL=1
MKTASILALIGLVLVTATLFVRHDLRGWEVPYLDGPQRLEPTVAGKSEFSIADCVPGTIDRYASPTAEEYSGSATVTVLTCRSRSSAIVIVLTYLAFAACLLFLVRVMSNRK